MPTILTTGSVQFIGMQSEGIDRFAFVLLRDITAGTQIHVTDNGWQAAGSFRTGEGHLRFLAAADMTAGTIVTWEAGAANPGWTDVLGGGSFALNSSGDQLIAFQGTLAAPTLLAGMTTNTNTATWDADAIDEETSALPNVAGNNHFPALGSGAGTSFANVAFVTGAVNGTADALRTQMSAAANYSANNLAAPITFPAGPITVNFQPGATAGNDAITGTATTDRLEGQDGDDTLDGGGGGDEFHGGPGTDTVSYASATTGIILDIGSPTLSAGDALGDTFDGIEYFAGSGLADQMIGSAERENFFAGGGGDFLLGFDGNDYLDGGADGDSIGGGAGDQDVAAYGSASAAVTLNLANTALSTGDAAGDAYTGIELYFLSDHNDTVVTSAAGNYVRGRLGVDTMTGDVGVDTFLGDAGDDQINGGGGNDGLRGGNGNDTIDGGDGNDTIEGSEGLDTLRGNDGNDTLRGLGENDTLLGQVGDDVIFGGVGDDTIFGGAGNDRLTGGTGAEGFLYQGNDGVDRIYDFTSADLIVFQNGAYNLAGPVSLGTNFFIDTATPAGATAYIFYQSATGRLFVDSDGNGAGGLTQIAELVGTPTLDATDFFIQP